MFKKYFEKAVRQLLGSFLSDRALAVLRQDLRFSCISIHNAVMGMTKRNLRRVRHDYGPLYLNLGSGDKGVKSAHWINVDGYAQPNVHFRLDLRQRLPFVDGFFDGVFTEHVLEHFNREEGLALLNECLRVLKPRGSIRIIVPDGGKIIKTYFDDPSELLRHRGPGFACAMDIVNSYFRQGYEHQFMYDREMLQHQLSSVGFACIRSVSFKQGKVPKLLIDNEDYEWESLYMEAEKLA